jgi:hypothetical protein
MLGICRVAAQLVASRVVLSCTEWSTDDVYCGLAEHWSGAWAHLPLCLLGCHTIIFLRQANKWQNRKQGPVRMDQHASLDRQASKRAYLSRSLAAERSVIDSSRGFPSRKTLKSARPLRTPTSNPKSAEWLHNLLWYGMCTRQESKENWTYEHSVRLKDVPSYLYICP